MLKGRELLRKIRETRGLLKLIDVSHLLLLTSINFSDNSLKNRIANEAIMRLWLYGGGGLDNWHKYEAYLEILRVFNIPEAGYLLEWCNSQQYKRTFQLPEQLKNELDDSIFEHLSKELKIWEDASGSAVFVPRNNSQNHYFSEPILLPFDYSDQRYPHHSYVRTGFPEDSALRDLSNGVKNAEIIAMKYGFLEKKKSIEISFNTLYGNCSEYMIGDSLEIPALIATILKKKKITLSPFTLAGSGIMQHNQISIKDSTYNIKAKTFIQAGIKRIILPEGVDYGDESVFAIPAGSLGLDKLQDIVISMSSQKITASDLLDDTNNFISAMRYGKQSSGEVKIGLKNILEKMGNADSPRMKQVKILATLGLASAYCHLGGPNESNDLCRKVIDMKGISPRYKALALIRQGVNLTDMTLYKDALNMFENARKLIPNVNDEIERLDLEMQEVGSRGQTLFNLALHKPQLAEESFAALEEACDIAAILDEDNHEEKCDLPRDKCYVYQAYALLKPMQSESIRNKVENICLSDDTTREFFIRTRWLAAYRAMLIGGCLNWEEYKDELPTSDWLRGTALKYRAALRALKHEYPEAESDFRQGMEYTIDSRNTLLTFIGMTIAVQAWDSLKDSESAEFAEECYEKAKAFFNKTEVLQTYKYANDWQIYLENRGECIENPQVKFVY